jgi:hypothetical protein
MFVPVDVYARVCVRVREPVRERVPVRVRVCLKVYDLQQEQKDFVSY